MSAWAIAAEAPGGPDRMRRVEIPVPEPGPRQVRVRHTAIGINYLDVYFRMGRYPWPVDADLILGSEAAGVVEACGAEVSGFEAGQRVAYTIPNGAYATHRTVAARHLVRLPDGIADETAAAAMLKGLTVHYLVNRSFAIEKGHSVLFHAAAGGTGLIAGQWIASLGATAIGTAGGPEKCALAAQHGYAHSIDYRGEDFVARVKEITGGAGVEAVYDSVGADTWRGSLQCLKPFGTLVNFGQSSGPAEDFRLQDLASGSFTATRPMLYHFTELPGWLEKASAELFERILSGALRIPVNQTFPLAEAAAAHEALEARATTGATVLIP